MTSARKGKGRETLRATLERALAQSEDPAKILALLHRLSRQAVAGSADALFADANLAEMLVERHPWRASLHARRALATEPALPAAWSALALAQTLLGHFRFAARAYERALALAPGHAWYAHNLGHLLDVAIGAPERALPLLSTAYTKSRRDRDVAASYAHALARTGRTREAVAILERVLARGPSPEHTALLSWIAAGTPPRAELPLRARAARAEITSTKKLKRPATPTRGNAVAIPAVTLREFLVAGLVHLPFSREQRARALALAHEVTLRRADRNDATSRDDARELAAACCLAVVEERAMPLSAAEVGAPFRLAMGRLRARTFELRKELALLPVRHERGVSPEGR